MEKAIDEDEKKVLESSTFKAISNTMRKLLGINKRAFRDPESRGSEYLPRVNGD